MFPRKSKPSVEHRSDSLRLLESTVKGKNGDDGVKTWSTAIQILLPVAALAILWGRRGFFARFFLQFDKNCVSVLCPSFSKRQRLLRWASGRLPQTWSSHSNTNLPEFWKDGSLLCTLINSAIPEACPNPHRHWRRPPSHGQALAYKYLGVVPIFTESDLSETILTAHHERVLLQYLLQIQQAITRISVPEFKFSSCYVAKGMGLVAGEQHRKNSFYIYSNSSTPDNQDVLVSIRGPYNTYNTVTVPSRYILRKPFQFHLNEKKRLAYQSKSQRSFLRSLSVDLGSFINTGQKQNVDNEIPVKLITEKERVKVVYIPKDAGIHEISIITNGFHLTGSPYTINVSENTTSVVDAFDEQEKSPITRHNTKSIRKRIISKIIDFIDEKVTCENLKTLPIYARRIPQITVIQPKNKEEEEMRLDNEPSDQNEASNIIDHQRMEESTTNPEKYLNKEILFTLNEEPVTTFDKTTHNHVSKGEYDLKLDFIHQSSVKVDDTNNREHFHSDNTNLPIVRDSNNNTSGLKTKEVSLSPNASSAPSNGSYITSFTTSPICNDHIRKEVNTVIKCIESSDIPNGNFKKNILRKQSKGDRSNKKLSDPEVILEYKTDLCTKKNLELQTKKAAISDIAVLEEVENNYKQSPKDCYENLETESLISKRITSIRNVNAVETTTTISENDSKASESSYSQSSSKYQRTSESENQIKLNGSKFPESNSLNILNYLSSLKTDNSTVSPSRVTEHPHTKIVDCNHHFLRHQSSPEATIVAKNRTENDFLADTFKQRMKYWESQTNLNIANKRTRLKHRRSLPNLFSFSGTGLVFFPSIDDYQNSQPGNNHDDLSFQSDDNAMELSSLYHERQKYWRALSGQTVSYSSITSSLHYSEDANRNVKNRLRARHSLPNLFSDAQKQEFYNHTLDFYDSPDFLKFRNRFKECREYWEKLSSQNLNHHDHFTNMDSCQDLYHHDDNFDSGFCSSLPNLWIKSRQDLSDSLIEDVDSLQFKMQYKERQGYWKRLSSHTSSNASLNDFYLVKYKNQNEKAPLNESLTEQSELDVNVMNTYKKYNERKTTLKSSENSIKDGMVVLSAAQNEKATNLTDDLKSVEDQREKMRIHFYNARNYFKSLENCRSSEVNHNN